MEDQASLEQHAVAAQANNICGYDYMSVLSDDIASHAFSFLSMEEAFRTRLVCCRWRYLCVPVLNLELNSKIIFNSRYEYYSSTKEKSELWEFESDFVRKVDQYLVQFPGKKLVSFSIIFSFRFGNEFASHVDKWISFALRMDAEGINLHIPFSSSRYTFPCHLLRLGGGSHLKFLRLKSCLLRPPLDLVNRLNSLKSLELNDISLKERDMDVILPRCLNLESLILKACRPIGSLRLEGHAPQLKWLFVHFCFSMRNIELNSPRLERFEYKGVILPRFNFSKPPPLTKVFLLFYSPLKTAMDFMFECLPKDFPLLQNLTVSWCKALPIPARMTAFGCLENLHWILYLSSNFNLLSVTYVVNASPVLEKFHLSLHAYPCRGDIPKEDYSGQQYLQLKEVAINGFRDNWNAVQLAIYLLKNAVALERMIINKTSSLYDGGDKWTYCDGSDCKLTPDEIHDLLFKEKVNPTTELLIM